MEMPKNLKVPTQQMVKISELKEDSKNPNVMSPAKLSSLKNSIMKFGFTVPIITNKDLLIADGHQRKKAAEELGYTELPVIALQVKEVDRKLLQQTMNKLKGTHDPILDGEAFQEILAEEDMEDVVALIGITEQEILQTIQRLEESENPPPKVEKNEVEKLYTIQVKCPKCGHEFEKKKE